MIATFDVSLLLSETVTPLAGAGTVRFTGNGSVWLGPTDTLPGKLTEPEEADRFVSVKTAGVATPAAEAVTVNVPGNPFAVSVWDLASPDASVMAVFTPPAKVAPAPLPEERKVTVTPLTGFDPASRTIAESGSPNGVFTCAVCGVPPLDEIDVAVGPGFPTITVVVLSGIKGGAEA